MKKRLPHKLIVSSFLNQQGESDDLDKLRTLLNGLSQM